MYKLLSVVLLFTIVHAKHEQYDGSSLYEVKTDGVAKVKFIEKLESQFLLDVWAHPTQSRGGQILVPKDKNEAFQNVLRINGIEFNVLVENIKEALDLEDQMFALHTKGKTYNRTATNRITYDRIHTYDEVSAYLDDLAAAYPDVVKLVVAGKSVEGRDLKYLKISTTNFEDTSKPVIYMESLLHSREWITLPSTLYAIEQLVIERNDPDLLDKLDWIIYPIANPDGFVATHNDERLWRKNRARGFFPGDICFGVDLNRNFDMNWSEYSSSLACMETFHGSGAFSEPETQVVRDIMLEYQSRLRLVLDVHCFGSYVLYGYGDGTLPANALTLHLVGVQLANAIDAVKAPFNSNYEVGNVVHILYEASGSAQDYAQSIGVPLSYTLELPGYRGAGQTTAGFLVDPSFIPQAAFETWEGTKSAARYVIANYQV